MKSFCIKTNNQTIINYLLNEFTNMDLEEVYISNHSFKNYDNIILHYTGENIDVFYDTVCKILSICILIFFEKKLLKNIIDYNYFYFEPDEKAKILETSIEMFDILNEDTYIRYKCLHESLQLYLNENKAMILEGFIRFRLKDYMEILDYTVDKAVNQFIIDREYTEFVNVLQFYIATKTESNAPKVHLIYTKTDSFLIDENKNLIKTDNSLSSPKYLSDITFSNNDYILNTLLNILPSKLTIHLVDKDCDEFITTLKLIFENKVSVCTDCSICNIYRFSNITT